VIGEELRDPTELDTPGLTRWDTWVASNEGSPTPLAPVPGELTPVAPRKILAATWRTFALLVVVGLGWSLWALGDIPSSVAAAPAFGAPILALVSFTLERLGAPLGAVWTSTLACALAGGFGYGMLAFHRYRHGRRLDDPHLVLEQRPALDP
jgi:hypothetical protein